jgi:hypothetical protein
MTCLEDTLVWTSPSGSLHGWDMDGPDEPYEFQGEWPGFWYMYQLSSGPNLDILGVCKTAAIRFAIRRDTGGEERAKIRAILPAEQPGEYYAIEDPAGRINLWDSLRDRRIALALDSDSIYFLARDGANRLLVAEKAGRGLIIHPATGEVRHTGQLPVLSDVAGDPGAGFWLADGRGAIYCLDLDLQCIVAASPLAPDVSRARIYAWPGLVVWWGLHAGDQTGDRLVFLQPKEDGRYRLNQLGARFFPREDGQIHCLTYDAASNQVFLIWQSSTRFGRYARFGTPRAFLQEREEEKLLHGVDLDITDARFDGRTCGLYLLSESYGSLFRLDGPTLNLDAVLSCSERIVQLALHRQSGPLMLTGERKRVFLCSFEKGETDARQVDDRCS